jgi:aldose 1-epimerase
MVMPPAHAIAIEGDGLFAAIRPDLGAGLERFDLDGMPIFRAAPPGTEVPFELACNLLVPWSNRISGGGFHVGERFVALAPNLPGERYPLHGNGFQEHWTPKEQTRSSAVLELVSRGPGDFCYEATVEYRIENRSLVMNLMVINLSIDMMPFGLGVHPWLPRDANTLLKAAARRLMLEDERHLPTGEIAVSSKPSWDFNAMRPLPEGWINNAFLDWDGRAAIAWPDRGLSLTIESSTTIYLLFSPSAEAEFFCFEPVSHLVDAHNAAGGHEANGLRVLRPGEPFAIKARFSPEHLA